MQLAILIAVLAALTSAEGSGPVAGVAWRLMVVACAAPLAPLAALAGATRLLGRSRESLSRLHAVVIGVWLAAVAVMLFVGQWPTIVRANWSLGGWPLVDEVVILLPVIGPLLLIWAAFEHATGRRLGSGVSHSPGNVHPPLRSLVRQVWLHARHHLGLVLLPPLVLIGAMETLAAFGFSAGSVDSAWWVALPLLATMLVLMPLAVRCIWRTTPLPEGLLRHSLLAICQKQKCRLREILIWHTGGTVANAAVVGLSRWLRYLLLTDVLLSRLSANEVAAVVRHEMAHLRRWHLPLRLAVLVLPLAGWLAVKHRWPTVESDLAAALEFTGLTSQAIAPLALPLAMLAYAVIVLGWCSRLMEHDADLAACLADDGGFCPRRRDDFCHALVTVCGKGRESRLAQWLHPPLAERLAFLDRAGCDARVVAACRRRIWHITLAIGGCYAAAIAVLVF